MEHTAEPQSAKPKRGRGRPRNPQQLDEHQTWLTLADLFRLHDLSAVAIARRGGDTNQLVRAVWAALGIEARLVFGLQWAYLVGVHEGSVRGGRRHNTMFRRALQTLLDAIQKALRAKGQRASHASRACALLLTSLPVNEGSGVSAADALPPLRIPMTRYGKDLSRHERLRLLTRRIDKFTE